MSLLSGTDLLAVSAKTQLALPAFDVAGGNVDMLHAIGQELAACRACAFLASTPSSIRDYYGYAHFVTAIREMAGFYDVQVAAHLDHASDVGEISAAIEAGCTSVLVDGSSLPFERNIELTKATVQKAHQAGVSVEGELGVIGGKEDECVAETSQLPTLAQALEFAETTGIDFFAPAIGTAHGFYKSEPRLDWSLARGLASSCTVPLVLHGGTGLESDVVTQLIHLNFRKINYATGVRAAFVGGLKNCLINTSETIKPQAVLRSGRESVGRFVRQTLQLVMRH